MIVSKENNICIFLNPKTGTTTLCDIFKDKSYVDFLIHEHLDYTDYKKKYPDLDNMNLYSFYRNPVDRFISAYSYALDTSTCLAASRIYTYYINPSHLNAFNTHEELTESQLEEVKSLSIKDILTHKSVKSILRLLSDVTPGLFFPQVTWLDYEGINLLDFNNFEHEVKKLLTLCNEPDIVTEIPRLNNVSPVYTNITEEEISLIQTLYEKDYEFFSSKNITF